MVENETRYAAARGQELGMPLQPPSSAGDMDTGLGFWGGWIGIAGCKVRLWTAEAFPGRGAGYCHALRSSWMAGIPPLARWTGGVLGRLRLRSGGVG
jgi:hypothetical protein